MLPVRVVTFIILAPVAVFAVPAFKMRLSRSYEQPKPVENPRLYAMHRGMRHGGGLTLPVTIPMPIAHTHPRPQPRPNPVAVQVQEGWRHAPYADRDSSLVDSRLAQLSSKTDLLLVLRNAIESSGSTLHALAAASSKDLAIAPVLSSQCADEIFDLWRAVRAYQGLVSELVLGDVVSSLAFPGLMESFGDVTLSVAAVMEDVCTIMARIPALKTEVQTHIYEIKNVLDELLDVVSIITDNDVPTAVRLDLTRAQHQLGDVIDRTARIV